MDNTKIKLSRGTYTENSREIAILHLDLKEFSPGEPAIVNYYTDNTKSKVDTIFAIGVKSGIGRDCYKIISTGQFIVVWDVVDKLPDVSKLYHGELYLYTKDNLWYLVYSENRIRTISPIPLTACTYICLKDNNFYVTSENGKVKRVNDLITQGDVEKLIENLVDISAGGGPLYEYSLEKLGDESVPEYASAVYRLKKAFGNNFISYPGDEIVIPKINTEGSGISINNSEISVKIAENGGIEVSDNGELQLGEINESKFTEDLQTMLSDIKKKFYAISISVSRSGSSIYFTDEIDDMPEIVFSITVKDSNGNMVPFEKLNLTCNQEGTFSNKSGYSAKFIPLENPNQTTGYKFTASYQTVGGNMTVTSGMVNITIGTTPFYTGTVNEIYANKNLTSENKQECALQLLENSTRNHTSISPTVTGEILTINSDDIDNNDTIALLSKNRIKEFKDNINGFPTADAFTEEQVIIKDTNNNDIQYYLYVKNTLVDGISDYKLKYY